MSRLPTSQAIEMMTEATSTARIGPSRRKSAAAPFVRPASALTARGLAFMTIPKAGTKRSTERMRGATALQT